MTLKTSFPNLAPYIHNTLLRNQALRSLFSPFWPLPALHALQSIPNVCLWGDTFITAIYSDFFSVGLPPT